MMSEAIHASTPVPGLAPSPGSLDIWYLRVDAATFPSLEALPRGWLDESERRYAERFVSDEHRLRYCAAHVGLRYLLGTTIGLSPGRVRFARAACPICGEPHGRPTLRGDADLQFSMSRSGDWVLYGLSAAVVGVDLEGTVSWETTQLVRQRLHAEEAKAIAELTGADAALAFQRCWVRKEAYLKARGSGLAGGLDTFYVGLGDRRAHDNGRMQQPAGWHIVDLVAPDELAAAAAMEGQGLSWRVRARRLDPALLRPQRNVPPSFHPAPSTQSRISGEALATGGSH